MISGSKYTPALEILDEVELKEEHLTDLRSTHR